MGGNGSKNSDNYMLECLGDHEDSINCIALSADQSLLVTGSEDKTVRMWSTKTGTTECLGIFRGHTSYVTCVTIYDTYVISGAADSTIRKWDMTTCECLVKYTGHTSRISRVVCDGNFIFSTSYDKTLKAWDFDPDDVEEDGTYTDCFRTFKGHTKGVYSLIFISDGHEGEESETLQFNLGDTLITGSADSTVRVWCPETAVSKKVLNGHRGPVICMATDPCGSILYTGSLDKTIRSWDIISGQCLKEMSGHEGPVIVLNVVNRLMYSGGQDGCVRCWVREFGDCTRVYKGHKHSIAALKFHDGLIYTGSGDTTIRVYDAKSGVLKRILVGHDAAVTCITIVEDKLYSGSFDGTLRVWNIKGIKNDQTMEVDEEEEAEQFQMKQDKSLQDLDSRLNGYIKNDIDIDSKPENCNI